MQTGDAKEMVASTKVVSGSKVETSGRTLVGMVERLELQVGRVVDLTDRLLEILGIPNVTPESVMAAMEPTVTTLDNRAYRVEEVTNHLSRAQERLEWALTEASKI